VIHAHTEWQPEPITSSELAARLGVAPSSVTEMVKNPQGSLHGGVMASAMDISMGHLIAKVAGPGATIEMKIQFMRPVMVGPVTCEGRFTKRGRSMSFMESRVTGPDGKLAALATATWKMPS